MTRFKGGVDVSAICHWFSVILFSNQNHPWFYNEIQVRLNIEDDIVYSLRVIPLENVKKCLKYDKWNTQYNYEKLIEL